MKYSRLFLWMGLWMLLSGTGRMQAQTNAALQAVAAGKRAAVFIDTPDASGSGFCIHASGVFVTNAHVVQGFTQAKVILSPGEANQQVISARVTHYDADRDLALLIADPPLAVQSPGRLPLTVLPLGNSNTLFETKAVAVFGFPFGADLAMDEREAPAVTVTVGRITSLRKSQGELKEIQLDAAVNPGNSGGPVIDDQGQLVGIVHAGVKNAQGVNFAIPTDSLRQLLKQPEIRFDLPEIDWPKRFDPQSFPIQVAPFTLFDEGPGARGDYDLEMAVGYDETWRNLTVKRNGLGDGKSTEFRVNGVFYQDNLPLDTDLMYRITIRQNGVVVASREDFVPTTGAPLGGALTFDGKSDNAALLLKNWPALGNTPHSIEMWVRPDSAPPGRAWLMLLGSGGTRAHHWLYFPNGDLYLGVMYDTSGQVKTTLPVGKWTHIATTFGNSVLKVYVNGEQVAQTNAKFDFQGDGNPAVPFSIAKGHLGESFFNGAFKEVRIWDRELSQADIRANMARSMSGNEPGLVLYWPLDEGEGNIVHDRSNHGNDVTLAEKDRWLPLDSIDLDVEK